MKLAVHKTYQFQPKAQKRMFARAVGAVGVRALARNIKSNSEYKGFAAEAIPVNLLPAPAQTHGNRARQLAPRAGTAARRAQSTKCIGNARVPRVTGLFARSASAGTGSLRKRRRALCARIWYESVLTAALWEGETLAFFRRFSVLAAALWEGETLAFFRRFCVLAAALWEGETLAFFRRFCLCLRPPSGKGKLWHFFGGFVLAGVCARGVASALGSGRFRERPPSEARALGSGRPRERTPSGADALGSGSPRERTPLRSGRPRERTPSGADALGSGRPRERTSL